MASELDRSIHHVGKSKLLKMDVIEMTLLLKSIGFRLNSIDYDDNGVSKFKSNENGYDNQSEINLNSGHSISVRISCSKSKMVSNLSYKYIEDEAKMTPKKGAAALSTVCTCPKREICTNNNNSFWEVQSSGTFANQRIAALAMTPDNNTFSNLLPNLPTKSIALTQVLIQVLLNQYQQSPNGEFSIKEVDVKSIMRAFENSGSTRKSMGGNGSISNKENLEPMTQKHSADPIEKTAPHHQVNEPHVNHNSIDDFNNMNAALNETVNTEAFSNSKSELITSSPNHTSHIIERDTTIIKNLNEARNSIDHALLVMKLNVTRNLTHEVTSNLLTVTPNMQNERNRMQIEPMQVPSQPSSRQSSTSNTPSTRLSRRSSTGGTSLKANSTSRIDLPKTNRTNAIERRASLSKLSMVRGTVSGLGNRNVGAKNSPASLSSVSKLPIQPTSKVNMKAARPSSISTSIARRLTSRPAATTSTSPAVANSTGLLARKTALTARLPSQLTKLAKKI